LAPKIKYLNFRNYEETSEQITFSQERFLVSEGPLTPDVEPFRWEIIRIRRHFLLIIIFPCFLQLLLISVVERLLFCVTAVVYFVIHFWRPLSLVSLLHSIGCEFCHPSKIDFYILDGYRETDWLSLSLRYCDAQGWNMLQVLNTHKSCFR